jgi:hypothetical protein
MSGLKNNNKLKSSPFVSLMPPLPPAWFFCLFFFFLNLNLVIALVALISLIYFLGHFYKGKK